MVPGRARGANGWHGPIFSVVFFCCDRSYTSPSSARTYSSFLPLFPVLFTRLRRVGGWGQRGRLGRRSGLAVGMCRAFRVGSTQPYLVYEVRCPSTNAKDARLHSPAIGREELRLTGESADVGGARALTKPGIQYVSTLKAL